MRGYLQDRLDNWDWISGTVIPTGIDGLIRYFRDYPGATTLTPRSVLSTWRSGTIFTAASIYAVHPYFFDEFPVGETFVIVQPCIRTTDISLAGDGTHMILFTMIGYIAFVTEISTAYDLAEGYLTNFFTTHGITRDRVSYSVDIWSGGDLEGDCYEVYLDGIEVATVVFIRHESGWVLDLGIGLERIVNILYPPEPMDFTPLRAAELIKTISHLIYAEGILPTGRAEGSVMRQLIAELNKVPDSLMKSAFMTAFFNNHYGYDVRYGEVDIACIVETARLTRNTRYFDRNKPAVMTLEHAVYFYQSHGVPAVVLGYPEDEILRLLPHPPRYETQINQISWETDVIDESGMETGIYEYVSTITPVNGGYTMYPDYNYIGRGGQPADNISIDGYVVTDISQTPHGPVYHIDSDISVGESVIQIDRETREAYARAHTALHLCIGNIQKNWGRHIRVQSTKLSITGATFTVLMFSEPTPTQLASAEVLPDPNLPVIKSSISRASFERGYPSDLLNMDVKTVRLVEIPGISIECCGGTHVDNTAQIPSYILSVDRKMGENLYRLRLTFK